MRFRNLFHFFTLLIALFIFLVPEKSTADVEATLKGKINMFLYEKGTGAEERGNNELRATVGDTLSIEVYLRNFQRERVTGLEIFFTVDDEYFDFVSYGKNERGDHQPFIQGDFMRVGDGNIVGDGGNSTHRDSLTANDNNIDGWQFDYIEQTPSDLGFGRPYSAIRHEDACTFQLIAKAPCDSITITLDKDHFYQRESRYQLSEDNYTYTFKMFETCYISVTGVVIDPPLPDILMSPGTTNTTLDLDDHIEIGAIPDSLFIWTYSGDSNLGVSIDPDTHEVTFTAPFGFHGYEDITFTVGTATEPDLGTDTMRVTVDYPPVLNSAAIPDTIYIYEDSLQVVFDLTTIVTDQDNQFNTLAWEFETGGNVTTQKSGNFLFLQGKSNFNGRDYLKMTVRDDLGIEDSETVIVWVYPVSDPPTLSGLPDAEFERTKSYEFDMLDYAEDLDGDILTITYVPVDSLNVNVSGSTITITEVEGFLGARNIVFTVTDPGGLSASDTMSVTVTPLKNPPVWSKIPKIGFPQNESFSGLSLWDYVDDPDGSDSQLSFSFSNYDDVDSIYVSPADGRLYLYDLDNAPGWDMITVTATDYDENEASTRFLTFIGPADGTPIVGAIPDTTLRAGTEIDWIDLDDYYYDIDNQDSEMIWTWSHGDETELVIITIKSLFHTTGIHAIYPDSTGIDNIVFTVTDPDNKSANDNANVKVLAETKPLLDMPAKIGFVAGEREIIDLDDYTEDPDFPNSDLTWSWRGNSNVEIGYEENYLDYTNPLYFTGSSEWTGWEKVKFEVRNPLAGSAVDSTLVFSVSADGTPIAGGLERVKVRAGFCDSLDLDLDNYYFDADTNDWGMTWTVSGNDSVIVTIDPLSHAVKFCSPSQSFEGQETVTFTVSDGEHTAAMDVVVIVYGAVFRNVFSMLLFRNPMQGDYMDIYLTSTKELFTAPSLEVRVEGDTTAVPMKSLTTNTYYHGMYLLPYETSLGFQRTAVVIANGTTKTGQAVQDTLGFSYGRLGAAGGKLAFGPITVTVPEGALKTPETLTIVPQRESSVTAEKPAGDEITFTGDAYTIGPMSLSTDIPMEISFDVCCRPDGAGIYRSESDGWVFAGGEMIDGTIWANTYSAGTFRLGYDRTAPIVKPLDSVPGTCAFRILDFGSGVDGNSLKVLYEGDELIYTYDEKNSVFVIQLPEIPGVSAVSLDVSVSDRAGNKTSTILEGTIKTVPGQFIVEQNVPNPFNPYTTITFIMTSDQRIIIEIYDILGRKVRILTDDFYPAGTHKVIWKAEDNNGRTVSSGTYFYRVRSGSKSVVRKMVFIR